jgi:hypothetical protein
MPPTPSPAPAKRVPPRHRLRPVTGGYDLDPLPIHVPPRNGESAVSWLRRLSVRYDTPTRDLLRGAGEVKAVTGTTKVISRLRNNRALLRRLGLDDDETSRLLAAAPLIAATLTYSETFGRDTVPARPWMRYCPHCLAGPDPVWPDHWRCPLSLICPEHGVYLLQTCPGCLQKPHASPAWLTHPVELQRCPSRVHAHDSGRGRRRLPWCDTDLSTAPTLPASAEQVAGQRRLHEWAAGAAEHATACGLAVTHRLGFQALVELLDAHLSDVDLTATGNLLELANDPATIAAGLPSAVQVLDQPSLNAAAQALGGRMSYSGPHAPLGPAWRIAEHHYSPLLAAVQLHSVRDQLSAADQLMFRTGHPAPRYPATITVKLRRRLRLPDHHPHRPEPQISWIPQAIWPLAVPAALTPCTRPELRGTMLAMCLAKMGSTARWTSICDDLALPASHANRIAGLLRYIKRAGHWPDVLASLERLMTLLQQHPPPIDYQARRAHAGEIDALTEAVDAARRIHPSPRPTEMLVRQLWERFTGGDIAYAPSPLHLDPAGDEYVGFRSQHTLGDADLFHVAHRRLQQLLPTEGPLTWAPCAVAEPGLPDIQTLLRP